MLRQAGLTSTLEAVKSAMDKGGAGTVTVISEIEAFAVMGRTIIHHQDIALANQARAILKLVQDRS